jgi:hypothetical protein
MHVPATQSTVTSKYPGKVDKRAIRLVGIFAQFESGNPSNGSYGGDEWGYSEEADMSISVKKKIAAAEQQDGVITIFLRVVVRFSDKTHRALSRCDQPLSAPTPAGTL